MDHNGDNQQQQLAAPFHAPQHHHEQQGGQNQQQQQQQQHQQQRRMMVYPREIPEERRIEDMDGWLRSNGLGAPHSQVHQEEERARLAEFQAYEAALHERIFHDADQKEAALQQQRQAQLAQWQNETLDIYTADGGCIRQFPLQPLAACCDTVFAMAASWHQFQNKRDDDGADNSGSSNKSMYLQLDQYPESSVRDFLALVLSNAKYSNSKCNINQYNAETATINKKLIAARDLQEDSVVDCCQMAHYLQNSSILQDTVQILLESIDSHNCLSMCQLADQLHLSELFERSLNHLIQSMGNVEDDSNAEAWECLTPELQERINVITKTMQSSIGYDYGGGIDNCNNMPCRRRLYFSSLQEYVSIFAERVQYYRERLAEAQEQWADVPIGTRLWHDTGRKIEKQSARVRTLERILQEHKQMLAHSRRHHPLGHDGDGSNTNIEGNMDEQPLCDKTVQPRPHDDDKNDGMDVDEHVRDEKKQQQ